MNMIALLTKTAAGIAAAGAIGTGLWTFGEVTETRPIIMRELHAEEAQIAENFKVVQAQIQTLVDKTTLIEWSTLNAKLEKNGSLDFQDRQRYCSLSRALGYVGIAICGF